MKPKIYNETELTGIETVLVWTLDKFPDFTRTDIPEHYKQPTWIYIKSGQKSDCLSFLKFSCIHDTESSWNPADLYGPRILNELGLDSGAYQSLESCLFPEIIDTMNNTNYRFFGQVTVSGAEIALLRLPENTWRVDVYPDSGFTENYPGGLLVPGDIQGITKSPCIGITYGPDPELLNNPVDMYYVSPIGADGKDTRTESVTQIEYKRLMDELKAPKVLAINIHSTGVGKINTINLPVGAWGLEDNPERHKSEYYLGKTRLTDESEPGVTTVSSGTLVDSLTGTIIGTNLVNDTPIKRMIYREANSDNPTIFPAWSRIVRYTEGQQVYYNGTTYKSIVSDNIGENPVTSGFWKISDIFESAYEESRKNYNIVTLTTGGGGKLYFPEKNVKGEYPELPSKVATTEKYIRLRIKPDSGYVLSGLQTYSFDLDQKVSNLIADYNGTYVLNVGPESGSGGYDFCIEFDKIGLNLVTDFYVPGINYYTFVGDGRYSDHDRTYHTTSPDSPTEEQLPMCTGMPISYLMNNEVIEDYQVDDSSIIIPETIKTLGNTISITYHGLLEYYDVKSVQFIQYRGMEVSSKEYVDWGLDGDSLVVSLVPTEVTSHIVLEITPKQILLYVEPEEGIDSSITGGYLNIGETFKFQVYSEVKPEIELVGFKGIRGVHETRTTGLWDIHISEVSGSGTIIVKQYENR